MKKKITNSLIVANTFLMPYMLSCQIFMATSIGNNLSTTGKNLLLDIKNVYCTSIGWLLLAVNLLITAFSHNKNVLEISKKACWACIIVYIVLQILVQNNAGVIGTTTDELTNWISG